MWCDHQVVGRREIVRMACILAFVNMISILPSDYTILACFLPAPFVATYGIVHQIWRVDFIDRRFAGTLGKNTRFLSWFGNSNYAAAYLVPQVFMGLWLSRHQSIWFLLPVTIIVAGIVISKCRAAQLAMLVGACILQPILIPIFMLAGFMLYRLHPGCFESIGHRFLMVRAAMEIWKHWPIFGAGPRCFRHKHNRAVAEINSRDETVLGRPGKPGRFQFTVGRRAHNDIVETFAEYGLIGATLAAGFLVTVLVSLWEDRILFAAAAAFSVNAVLFLSFRDTAVSLPFWCLAAVSMPSAGAMYVPPLPGAIIAASAIYIGYVFLWKPFLANWVADRGDPVRALMLQPYASEYLFRIAILSMRSKPMKATLAYNCAEKALFYYDGERPEWEILRLFGQIALMIGAVDVAAGLLDQALIINPSSKPCYDACKQVREVQRNLTQNLTRLDQEHERKVANGPNG
jgi:hypothetical protein